MTYLYPIKSGTENHDELLYSVRSVAKFYSDAQIHLIADKLPDWANDKVQITVFKEQGYRGAANVWDKLRKYRQSPYVLMNDDIFINRYFDYTAKHLFSGTLEERGKDLKETNFYKQRVNATRSFTMAACGTERCYDIHQPFFMHSDSVTWMHQHLKMDERHYLFKSIIGNMNVLPSVAAVHVKLTDPAHYSKDMLYFSCNDEFMQNNGKFLLHRLYGMKSRFEK